MLVAQDGLHCLHIAGRSKHPRRQRPTPAVRAAELYPRLAVEPADRLLPSITGPVYLGAALQLAVLECQLEGLAFVGHHQPGVGPKASVLNLGADTPSAPQAHSYPLLDTGEALRLGQVDVARPTALGYLGSQVHLRPDRPTGIEHVAQPVVWVRYSSITSRSVIRPVTDATRIRWRN